MFNGEIRNAFSCIEFIGPYNSLGWRGKHTLLINKEHGSWFFLGEIYINLPLPIDKKVENHCGTCTSCLEVCPTKAIIGPYKLDARKCISYLTIEHKSSIPLEYRKQIGNRVYGCDDCQLYCPWNKFGQNAWKAVRFFVSVTINGCEIFQLDSVTLKHQKLL